MPGTLRILQRNFSQSDCVTKESTTITTKTKQKSTIRIGLLRLFLYEVAKGNRKTMTEPKFKQSFLTITATVSPRLCREM